MKGHQDDNTEEIPVEASYNVRADELAGQVAQNPSRSQNFPWLLPVEKCRLLIAGKPIHGNYTFNIRQQATLLPYFEYLRHRHRWSTSTQQDIDWQVMGLASQNTTIPQTQLLKLVHDKLPTRYELGKVHPHQDSNCCYCNVKETFTHLIRCTNPLAQDFRQDFLETIESYLQRHDAPTAFRQTFLLSIQYWLEPPSDTATQPHVSITCFRAQNKIGWALFPRGFWSKEWRQLYDRSQPSFSDAPSENKTTIILSGLVRTMWTTQIKYWNLYSKYQQEPESLKIPPSLSTKRHDYHARIRALHQRRRDCLHAHQTQYFHESVDDFLDTATIPQMRTYLHHYEPAITHSIREAAKIKTRTLFTFPGFHLHVRRPRSQPRLSLHHRTQSSHNMSASTGQRGDFIRKHTRWRTVSPSIKSIREFFMNPPPPEP